MSTAPKLILPRIGDCRNRLELERRGLFRRCQLLLFRHDDRAHAAVAALLRGVAARLHGKELGLGVVGDGVAANVVATVAAQPRLVEEFDALYLAVVLDPERLAVDVFVDRKST